MSTIYIFVSYSHENMRWLQEGEHSLIPWLARALKRSNVEFWDDHELKTLPGEEYKKKIEGEINKAHFAILLISQEFLNSEFICDYELPWIRERFRKGELSIIPILVGPVAWGSSDEIKWLSELQIIPGKPTPLIENINDPAKWSRAQVEILEAIQNRIKKVRKSTPSGKTERSEIESSTLTRAKRTSLKLTVILAIIAIVIGLSWFVSARWRKDNVSEKSEATATPPASVSDNVSRAFIVESLCAYFTFWDATMQNSPDTRLSQLQKALETVPLSKITDGKGYQLFQEARKDLVRIRDLSGFEMGMQQGKASMSLGLIICHYKITKDESSQLGCGIISEKYDSLIKLMKMSERC